MIDILIFILTALLCILGILLSALAFSGTWVVLAAALITFFTTDTPPLSTLILFALFCIIAEVIEALAGWYGVQKRGGSKLAGLAAMAGGLIGAIAGSAVLPIAGTILGMLAGSFVLAFAVERNRLKHNQDAANIAVGAVFARLGVMLMKTVLTVTMSLWLLIGLLR